MTAEKPAPEHITHLGEDPTVEDVKGHDFTILDEDLSKG